MSRRKQNGDAIADRKLMDRIALDEERLGPMRGLLATTYELDPEFFEIDFLPTLLGLGAWDDRSWTTRIAMEKSLALMEAAAVVMEAGRYRGRPRSLRLELTPYVARAAGTLHAKVLVLVYDRAIRLLVGSSNLTTQGYRHNREVMLVLTAMPDALEQAALIRSALDTIPDALADAWSPGAERVRRLALEHLAQWGAPRSQRASDERFVWSGGPTPLRQTFLDAWPGGEPVRRIRIVSPFWSEERGDGPLEQLLGALQGRNALSDGCKLELGTEAHLHPDGHYRPVLPPSVAALDTTKHHVEGSARAVSPRVLPEEVGMPDFRGVRPLHAKVVLLEGPTTSLAYAGSANFTASGWGFLPEPTRANIEAGVILRRTGRDRGALAALIPDAIGEPVELGGSAADEVTAPEQSAGDPPWPSFVRDMVLTPARQDPESLELAVHVEPASVAGPWSLATADEPARTLLQVGPGETRPEHHVPVDRDTLGTLLRTRELAVSWWASEASARYPLNVALPAREHLPIAPGARHPGEQQLLAYYQGRVAWEELYPDPEEQAPADPASDYRIQHDAVDTTRIQSYQIRSFVEALEGIRQDMLAAAVSEPAMRLALTGPVSPVALARQVTDAVREGERTPTAGGFQLVEILGCIHAARARSVPERLREAWSEHTRRAAEQVSRLLDKLRSDHPQALGPSSGFAHYERSLRASFDRGARP